MRKRNTAPARGEQHAAAPAWLVYVLITLAFGATVDDVMQAVRLLKR
jgi:hypothetical protein